MRDTFVGIVAGLFVDAGNLNVGHGSRFFLGLGVRAVAAIRLFRDAFER